MIPQGAGDTFEKMVCRHAELWIRLYRTQGAPWA